MATKTGKMHDIMVEFAQQLGWMIQPTTNVHAATTKLSAPHGRNVHVLVPRAQTNRNIERSIARKIFKYGDEEKRNGWLSRGDVNDSAKRDDLRALARYLAVEDAVVENPPVVTPEPEPEVQPVSVKPWLAHQGPRATGGTRYESHAVFERTWPDGTTDYACRLEGCAFTAKDPLKVSRHWARSKNHGPRVEKVVGYTDPTYTEPIGPPRDGRRARVERMAQRLLDAMAGIDPKELEPSKLALLLADKLVAESSEETEMLIKERTPEDVLEAVRRLVDNGQYVTQRAENIELHQQVALIEAEKAEVEEKLKEAQNDWEALQSIILKR